MNANRLAATVSDLATRFPLVTSDILFHATAEMGCPLTVAEWAADNENAKWLDRVAELSQLGERWGYCVAVANAELAAARTL